VLSHTQTKSEKAIRSAPSIDIDSQYAYSLFKKRVKTAHVNVQTVRGKSLYGLFSNVGGAEMKKIIISVAIILLIVLTTLSLQGCFTPYPQRGDPDREWRDDERASEWWWDMHRP
jgi:hypothetical protein